VKSTKSGKRKPSAKRSLKDLTPKKTNAKGGATASDMKKSLIGNLPR
jgi:hypothetical protein